MVEDENIRKDRKNRSEERTTGILKAILCENERGV